MTWDNEACEFLVREGTQCQNVQRSEFHVVTVISTEPEGTVSQGTSI